jgi:hypothetical protein
MGGLTPGLGSVSGSPGPLCGYTSRLRLFGGMLLLPRFPGPDSWGGELRVLDDVNEWSLVDSGCESFLQGSTALDSRMGRNDSSYPCGPL